MCECICCVSCCCRPFCSLYNSLKLEVVMASTVKDAQPQFVLSDAVGESINTHRMQQQQQQQQEQLN